MQATVSKVKIGTIEFEGYQLDSGEYGLSGLGLASIVNKHAMTVSRFLQSSAFKTLKGEGFTVTHKVGVIEKGVRVNQITFVPCSVATQYLLGQVANGNQKALAIVSAILDVTLEDRIAQSFGYSPMTTEVKQDKEQAIISRVQARMHTKDAHANFTNACELYKVPARLAHDEITKAISGMTAKDAIARGYDALLEGEDPSIGLNYQTDAYYLEWIARAKLRFGSYRKGTWQERCVRAVSDTKPDDILAG